MNRNTIARKIYFYRILFYRLGNDGLEEVSWHDVRNSFNYINGLDFVEGQRYIRRYDGNHLLMFVHRVDGSIRGKIGIRRLTGLPTVENRGQESLLTLDPEECLLEPSHFLILKNNVLGMEFNLYAPRPTSLGYYVTQATEDIAAVDIQLLLRGDIVKTLKRIGSIKLLNIAIHRDGIPCVEKLDSSLASAFEEMQQATDAEQLEITLRTAPRKRGFINVPFRNALAQWLMDRDNREIAHTLKVRAINNETSSLETFDLLEDRLVAKRDVLKEDPDHRHVNSESMYQAIQGAYRELQSEINQALPASFWR